MKTPERSVQEREDALESALTCLYAVQPPKGFDAAWRAAVKKEEHMQMKPFHHARFWKIAAPAFAALLLAVGSILTGATNLNDQAPIDTLHKSQNPNDLNNRNEVYDSQPQLAAPMPAAMVACDAESESFSTSQEGAAASVSIGENDHSHIALREESSAQSPAEVVVSLGDRLSLGQKTSLKGIGQFFQNMLVFLVMALPVLVPLAAVCLVFWLVFWHRRRKHLK